MGRATSPLLEITGFMTIAVAAVALTIILPDSLCRIQLFPLSPLQGTLDHIIHIVVLVLRQATTEDDLLP